MRTEKGREKSKLYEFKDLKKKFKTSVCPKRGPRSNWAADSHEYFTLSSEEDEVEKNADGSETDDISTCGGDITRSTMQIGSSALSTILLAGDLSPIGLSKTACGTQTAIQARCYTKSGKSTDQPV